MIMSNFYDKTMKALDRVNACLQDKAVIVREDSTIRQKIPLGVSAPYVFFRGLFSDIPVVYLFLKDCEDVTPSVIKRHGDIIQNSCGLLPIFIFEKIESYKTLRLAKARVNHIVSDKVIFLPDLLFIVRKQTKAAQVTGLNDEIPAIAQLMVLFHLQKGKLNGCTTRQLAELLNVSYATVKRATSWLADNNVIHLEGKKEKAVMFNHDGKELWDYAERFLRNPIESTAKTIDLHRITGYAISGEAALAHYSMLSESSMAVAISKKELTALNRQFKDWNRYGDYVVQTWIYDPKLLADGDTVDRLSLYLSLKDDYDERVQIELENMLNEIQW